MKHDPPQAPDLSRVDGLACALFLPEGPPVAGVVISHGAGSAKESHYDFARVCVAHQLAALAFDARGHGESSGSFGPGAVDDLLAVCEALRARAGCGSIAVRGSSMGGLLSIHAAAADPSLCAVVAICPATDAGLRRSLLGGSLPPFAVDVPATAAWLDAMDVERAVMSLGDGTSLLLMHAAGDDVVPVGVSETLYAAAPEPKRLLVMPGGDHHSVQHDAELQEEAARFVVRAAGG